MRCYIALLTKDGADRYRIQLPDFPECATWSDTLADARLLAERMLAEEIALRATAGLPIPRPTAPEWLLDRAARMKAIPIVVSAPESVADGAAGRVSVNVELPAGLVERVDARARVHGVGRSDLLEKAARLALWETARGERVGR
ncbi:MAG TPA: type II toxin-antitoxin system HicB family antitoxin [Alphaproteobacteria bacterium]